MARINRREFLSGMMGVGAVPLAGCYTCATSVRIFDDLLRVSIRDAHVEDGSLHGAVQVRHRGPDDPDMKESNRDTFYTHYDGVHVLGYASDGTKILDIPVGDFNPGTTEREGFEAGQFPMVLTAMPEQISYDVRCPHADVGGQLCVYAGFYTTDSPDWETEGNHDPRTKVEARLRERGGGHRWITYGGQRKTYPGELSQEAFDSAKCTQRTLEGRIRTNPPDFSALPVAEEWLTRRDRASYELYSNEPQAPYPNDRTMAADVPDRIVETLRTTPWEGMDGVASTSVTLSLEVWKRLVGVLEGADGPRFPSCDSGGTNCSDSWEWGNRGDCRPGYVYEFYQFDPEDVLQVTGSSVFWSDYSVVEMRYEWDGLEGYREAG